MMEVLWFLLPVAAATGWWVGRNESQRRLQTLDADRPYEYLEGLRYLLNEQQDEALEVFDRLVRVDGETVETHIALGNLFRRRGEVDRAIRVHQSLIARLTPRPEEKSYAQLELAKDYLHAGLLDRAESLFKELTKSQRQVTEALRNLLSIYEREHEWEMAIETARRLMRTANVDLGNLIAHYYCDLSDNAIRLGDCRSARRLLRHALVADRRSVRASILEGDLEAKAGHYHAAIRAYRQIEEQDPGFLPEVIERLLDCMMKADDPPVLLAYLDKLRDQYNGYSIIEAATAIIRQVNGNQAADAFFKEQVLKRPSLRGLRQWARIELETSAGSKRRQSIEPIVKMLDNLLASKPIYQCQQCGFKGRSLHWQCPSCKAWSSVKPIVGIEGD